MTTRVSSYLRFSPRPSERALTLDLQRDRTRQYAGLYDLEIVAEYEDPKVSAKDLKRPGLSAALADLDEGRADGLLVYKLDRLTRSITDIGWLIEEYFEKRFALFSVSEQIDTRTANGQFALKLLTLVSEWERKKIGERTAEALQHLKEKGVRLGRVPFGMERTGERGADGRLEFREIAGELETAYRILELRAEDKSLREIAEVMIAEKRETQRGGRWHAATVQRVLARFEEAE